MIRILSVIFILLTTAPNPPSTTKTELWGNTGHRVIGEVASAYVCARASKQIEQLLNGESLAAVATWADEIKWDKRYKKYNNWHYVNYTVNSSTGDITIEKGELFQAIEKCISALKDPATPVKMQIFYLKMLIHLMGDLHQPLHLGHAEDKGGNTLQVQWFGKGTNLHAVWDSKLIGQSKLNTSEFASQLKRRQAEAVSEIRKGTIYDWGEESRKLSAGIYATVKKGDELNRAYVTDNFQIVQEQLFKAGVRLAVVLNGIYE